MIGQVDREPLTTGQPKEFAPHHTRHSTWPFGIFRSHNSNGRSVTFVRQQQLFLLEKQTTVLLSPPLRRRLSHHRRWGARLDVHSTRAQVTSWKVPMYVIVPNVCELPSVPIKRIDVPIEWIKGLGIAFEHRNSASKRSRRAIGLSIEGLALAQISNETRKS